MSAEQCKKKVWKDFHNYQCSRKPWKDGYCKQHHPDTVARRNAEKDARWKAEDERLLRRRRLEGMAPFLLNELKNLVEFLEPAEKAGTLNVFFPGLATLNGAREAITKAEGKP